MKPLAPLFLVLALLSAPGPAAASAPTCQGRDATLVGGPGQTLAGTSGDDVVVTRGASRVSTGEGNDLICVTDPTGRGKRLRLDTGAGDDGVRVSDGSPVKAFLGDGDDRYQGHDGRDVVFAGYPDSYDYSHIDSGTDRIRTGRGADSVRSAGGDDSIQLGRGGDFLIWEADSGVADGGPGRDEVLMYAWSFASEGPGTWLLDNRTGQLSRDGEVRKSFRGFDHFRVSSNDPMSVVGSKADEIFEVSATSLTVQGGAGDDKLDLGGDLAVVDGGAGRDGVVLRPGRSAGGERSVVVDLARDTVTLTVDDAARTFALERVEDAEVVGIPRAHVYGDGARNRLVVRPGQDDNVGNEACRIVVTGRGGGDVLRVQRVAQQSCPAPRIHGNVGNDLMTGSPVDDLIFGGPGRDTARGGDGYDLCRAEVTWGCEGRPS